MFHWIQTCLFRQAAQTVMKMHYSWKQCHPMKIRRSLYDDWKRLLAVEQAPKAENCTMKVELKNVTIACQNLDSSGERSETRRNCYYGVAIGLLNAAGSRRQGACAHRQACSICLQDLQLCSRTEHHQGQEWREGLECWPWRDLSYLEGDCLQHADFLYLTQSPVLITEYSQHIEIAITNEFWPKPGNMN